MNFKRTFYPHVRFLVVLTLLIAGLGILTPNATWAGDAPDSQDLSNSVPMASHPMNMEADLHSQALPQVGTLDLGDQIESVPIDASAISVSEIDPTLADSLLAGAAGDEFAVVSGGSGSDYGQAIAITTDGDYYVAGVTDSFGAGGGDFLLLKYTSDGALSWARTAGGVNDDGAIAVAPTADGGCIVAGATESYGSSGSDVLLLKYASDGTLSWAKTAGGGASDYAFSVAQTTDNGYIVAGWSDSYGTGGGDVLLLKFTVNGTYSWARTAGGANADWAHSVAQTTDGDYIVAGLTGSYGAGASDALLLKYAANGTSPGHAPPVAVISIPQNP